MSYGRIRAQSIEAHRLIAGKLERPLMGLSEPFESNGGSVYLYSPRGVANPSTPARNQTRSLAHASDRGDASAAWARARRGSFHQTSRHQCSVAGRDETAIRC